jgi:hypothetical protein
MALQCFVMDGPATGQGSRPVVLGSQHYTPRSVGGRGFPPYQPAADGCVAFFGGDSAAGLREKSQMLLKAALQSHSQSPSICRQSKKKPDKIPLFDLPLPRF